MTRPAAIISFIVSLLLSGILSGGLVFAQPAFPAAPSGQPAAPVRGPLRLSLFSRSSATPKTSQQNAAVVAPDSPPQYVQPQRTQPNPPVMPSNNYPAAGAPTSFFGSLTATKRYPVEEVPPNERIVYVPYNLPQSPYGMRGQPMPMMWAEGAAANGYWYPNMTASMYPYPLPGIPMHRPSSAAAPQNPPPAGVLPDAPPWDEISRQLWFSRQGN
ncbi:MAG: hypothetical protein LBH00_01680 [Planctomycetaceae bacterium]|jgi:hypothetical protein|nr:hypothetical protein [Planctomycetaceae bacterium]